MMEIHNRRANESDRRSVPHRRVAPRKAHPLQLSEERLQSMLLLFLDLGLNPREMSRISGFPLAVIVMGLIRLNEVDRSPALPW
jgi:hypothetical protein